MNVKGGLVLLRIPQKQRVPAVDVVIRLRRRESVMERLRNELRRYRQQIRQRILEDDGLVVNRRRENLGVGLIRALERAEGEELVLLDRSANRATNLLPVIDRKSVVQGKSVDLGGRR